MASRRRILLARSLAYATAFGFALEVGGSLYEHFVIDPVWPANPSVIRAADGGITRSNFWIPLHGLVTLLLVSALWATWPARRARTRMLIATAFYVAMRVWTFAYFVPRALAYERGAPVDAGDARTWVVLSVLRLPMVLGAAIAAWAAARALDRVATHIEPGAAHVPDLMRIAPAAPLPEPNGQRT